MDKEKQIEEMAEYIFGNAITHDTRFKEDCRSIAIDLYTAGYRKQERGEWIEDKAIGTMNQKLNCSVCNWKTVFCAMGKREYNFCPNCGAKMKGGAE